MLGIRSCRVRDNDWQVVVDADVSSVFDYLGLHEYAYPTFLPDDNGNPRPITRRRATRRLLVAAATVSFISGQSLTATQCRRLLLTEFGIDKDGSWKQAGAAQASAPKSMPGFFVGPLR